MPRFRNSCRGELHRCKSCMPAAEGLFLISTTILMWCSCGPWTVEARVSVTPFQFRSCRKAVRAVLVLFPLFGMHFLMTVYRSPANCGPWEVYQYMSKASDGLQVIPRLFVHIAPVVVFLLTQEAALSRLLELLSVKLLARKKRYRNSAPR